MLQRPALGTVQGAATEEGQPASAFAHVAQVPCSRVTTRRRLQIMQTSSGRSASGSGTFSNGILEAYPFATLPCSPLSIMSLLGLPMEQRLSLVTLAPHDLASATRFYQALGWKAAFQNEEVAFFQLPGMVLALWDRAQMARETGIAPERLGPGGTQLAYNCRRREEVDASVAAWRAAGGRVRRDPHDTDWGGRSSHVADPEGFLWEIAWNPAWTMDAEGRISMGTA